MFAPQTCDTTRFTCYAGTCICGTEGNGYTVCPTTTNICINNMCACGTAGTVCEGTLPMCLKADGTSDDTKALTETSCQVITW